MNRLNLDDVNIDFSNLIESLPLGVLSFDSDGVVSFVNNNFIKFGIACGDKNDRLLGCNIMSGDIFKNIKISNEIEELKKGNSFEKIIDKTKTLDGGEISLILKGSPLFAEGEFAGGVLIIEDIKLIKYPDAFSGIKMDSLNEIFNASSDALLILDADGFIRYAYGKKTKNLAAKRAFTKGKKITDFADNKSVEAFTESLEKIKSGALSGGFTFCFKTIPDDILTAKIFLVSEAKDKIEFIVLRLSDKSGQKNEREKFISEIAELRQFQLITESISDAVIIINGIGKISFWNKHAQEIFGFNKSEVFGKSIIKVFNTFNDEQLAKVRKEIKNKNLLKSVVTVFKKNGGKEIVEAKFTEIKDSAGDLLIEVSSITQRTEIEKELKSSEEKFRNIVTYSNELICNMEADSSITYVNPVFSWTLGYPESEIIGKLFYDFIDPVYAKKLNFNPDSFMADSVDSLEIPVITQNGEKAFLVAHIFPVYNFDNSIKNYSGIFTNVTEKREDEKKLLIIKSVFSASQDALYVISGRKIILANEAFLALYGYNGLEEVLGKDPLDFIADEDIARVAGFITARENRRETPLRYECLGKRKDNSIFYFESLTTSFEISGQVYIINEARDITERKRSQKALKESEEKYRSITENIDDFMWTAERIEGRLTTVFYTASVEKIMGYSQSELIKDTKLFIKTIHPDDFASVKIKFRNLMRSSIRNSEELEFRIITKQGNIAFIRNKIKLIRNEDRTVQKIFGLVSDISLKKKAEEELKKSTEGLMKLNETKDRFISIISHDLRTPFTSILGFTDLLLSDKDLNEEEKIQYVKFIQESAQSMFSLVNSLLDWTRLQTGRMKFEPAKIDAKNIVDKALRSLSGIALQKNIRLINDIEDEAAVFADDNMLLQVINNILSNSIKFTNSGGSITVSVEPHVLDRNYEFCIKDTGTGIKEENLQKLFKVDTKFTTEGTAGEKGSGLGLSLCKEIVEKHNGKIWVESEYGKGSEFKFTLPFASSSILYVEDSKTDRLLYAKIIKNIAEEYDVIVAQSGEEGFEKLESLSPALVITDHIMPPGMTGYDFAKKIMTSDLKNKPPVIVLSADIDRSISDDYYQLGVEYVFNKPVNLISFKMAVEKSLKKALKIK